MLIDHSMLVPTEIDLLLDRALGGSRAYRPGLPAPDGYEAWAGALFPRHVEHAFTQRHHDLWSWAWGLDEDSDPDPFVAVWPRGGGKALALDTAIPTPTGWTTMGDVQRGDVVFAHDGTPVEVLTVSDIQERPSCLVTFSDGSTVTASDDHLWTVLGIGARRMMEGVPGDWPSWTHEGEALVRACSVPSCSHRARGRRSMCSAHAERVRVHGVAGGTITRRRSAKKTWAAETLSTADLLAAGLHRSSDTRWAIPTCAPLVLPDAELPVDPYLLGCWLGDGASRDGRIYVGDADHEDMARLLAGRGHGTKSTWTRTVWSVQVYGLRPLLREIGVLGDKHVPMVYMRASAHQRLALLRGLLDSDGSVDKGSAAEFGNTNKTLAGQVLEIARSLGLRATLGEGRATIDGVDCGPVYRVYIPATVQLFTLPRKRDACTVTSRQSAGLRYITAIEPVGVRAVKCIGVAHPDHLYLAGEAMVPTHNTTTAELVTAMLGMTGRRIYAWYVTETQPKANNNVGNIGALLESRTVEAHYPAHADRRLTKYGHSRGWTSQRLMTAGGFTLDGIGLDTAQRGLKVEDQRPDLIVLDDIDGRHDSLATTAKKIATITESILPAGSMNVAVLAVQNLIIKDGFFARMSDNRADYLSDRYLSGPHPAIENFEYRWVEESSGVRKVEITSGEATWEGQDIESCERLIRRIGPTAFLRECQHKVKELTEGLVIHFDETKHMQVWSDDEIVRAIAAGKLAPFGGIDYGYWRFAFLLFAADRAGRIHVLDQYFSQRELLSVRARGIDAILRRYGIQRLTVYGDPANPTDAAELNKALADGWDDYHPQWRASASVKDKGSRLTGPDRINDLLKKRALLVRRGIGGADEWHLGMNASSEGSPQVGSRFLWELDNWTYEDPREGRAQDNKPDDNTADGADFMAALRYGIMSRLKPAGKPKPKPKERDPNIDEGYERMAKKIREQRARGHVA